MDWLTFIAALTGHLAWPLSVLAIFLVIRKPLAGLIPLLVRLKYKDLEIDFSRRLEEITAEVESLPQPEATALPRTAADDSLLALAETSPRAAILEARIRLESAAVSAARARNVTVPASQLRSPLQLVQLLEELDIIEARQAAVFHDLRGLRNSAAHATNFNPGVEVAKDYVRAANRLEQYLRSA